MCWKMHCLWNCQYFQKHCSKHWAIEHNGYPKNCENVKVRDWNKFKWHHWENRTLPNATPTTTTFPFHMILPIVPLSDLWVTVAATEWSVWEGGPKKRVSGGYTDIHLSNAILLSRHFILQLHSYTASYQNAMTHVSRGRTESVSRVILLLAN